MVDSRSAHGAMSAPMSQLLVRFLCRRIVERSRRGYVIPVRIWSLRQDRLNRRDGGSNRNDFWLNVFHRLTPPFLLGFTIS